MSTRTGEYGGEESPRETGFNQVNKRSKTSMLSRLEGEAPNSTMFPGSMKVESMDVENKRHHHAQGEDAEEKSQVATNVRRPRFKMEEKRYLYEREDIGFKKMIVINCLDLFIISNCLL